MTKLVLIMFALFMLGACEQKADNAKDAGSSDAAAADVANDVPSDAGDAKDDAKTATDMEAGKDAAMEAKDKKAK